MLVIERQRELLAHVRRKGAVTVRDAARELHANEVTVRRDLRALAGRGLIERTHGGAVLPAGFGQPTYGDGERVTLRPESLAIALEASRLISPGDSVILGRGLANLALAHDLNEVEGLTVVTNSLLIYEALIHSNGPDVILTGGSVGKEEMTLVGPLIEHSLEGIHATTAFLTADGMTAAHGLTADDLAIASADRALAAAAGRLIVLAESANLGQAKLCQVAPCRSIQIVITDPQSHGDECDRLRKEGVEVREVVTPSVLR